MLFALIKYSRRVLDWIGNRFFNNFFRCRIWTKLDTAHRRRMVSTVALKFLRYRVPFWQFFRNIQDESFSNILDDPWTRCDSSWLKKSFQKTKKDSSSELYRWGCLHWSNSPEEYLTESGIDVLIIFFVARFERNLILHTAGEWWVRWP